MKTQLKIAPFELVQRNEDNEAFTTSLKLAKKFNKRHKDVLRKIENLEKDTFTKLKIALSEYVNEQGKADKMYLLNRDAWSFIAMGFTGKDANKFKLDFIDAFNKMESYIREQAQKQFSIDWTDARANGKCIRKVLTGAVQALERLADKQGGVKLDKNGDEKPESRHYYETITRMVYKNLFGDGTLKDIRDKVEVMHLTFLSVIEQSCAQEIERLVDLDLGYHEIYAETKKLVIATVEALSVTRVESKQSSVVKLAWEKSGAVDAQTLDKNQST